MCLNYSFPTLLLLLRESLLEQRISTVFTNQPFPSWPSHLLDSAQLPWDLAHSVDSNFSLTISCFCLFVDSLTTVSVICVICMSITVFKLFSYIRSESHREYPQETLLTEVLPSKPTGTGGLKGHLIRTQTQGPIRLPLFPLVTLTCWHSAF